MLSEGDHFGEVAIIKHVKRTLSVRVISEEAKLLVLSREAFIRILGSIKDSLKEEYVVPRDMSARFQQSGERPKEDQTEEDPIWKTLREKLPWGTDKESSKKRKQLWNSMDANGNGYLSLAEVDKGMSTQLPELFDLKPVLIRAFNSAKTKSKAKGSKEVNDDDFVTKSEFRWLLRYMRKYFEFWTAFERIDKDGDRRVSLQEFIAAKL